MPDETVVFGRRLVPFAIGHWLALERIQSPFVSREKREESDLAVALYICSHRASEVIQRLQFGLSLWWRWWAWRLVLVSELQPLVFQSRLAMFETYLTDACKPPEVWCPTQDTRSVSAPELITIRSALMSLGYTATESLDVPIGQARMEHAALMEEKSQGKFSFVTPREREMAARNSERSHA